MGSKGCFAPRCIGRLEGEFLSVAPVKDPERNGSPFVVLRGARAIPTIHCEGPDLDVPVSTICSEAVLHESAGIGGIKTRVFGKCNREINHDWVKDGCSEHCCSVFESIVDICSTLTIQWWERIANRRSSRGIFKGRWEQKLRNLSHC